MDVTTDTAHLDTGVRLHHRQAGEGDDVLVLLHGYPQTSWQWRHVMTPLADAGYRVIAPDYRGAGHSSRPRTGYTKWEMAGDVHELLHDHLGLTRLAFVVGHDIGSMVATAYAFRYRGGTRALGFGEATQPGTEVFERLKSSPTEWHFTFHGVPDLPEALVAGRERLYLQHFFDRHAVRPTAVAADVYATAYEQAGAMRAGFELYRAFEQDAADIRRARHDGGRLTMPCLGMFGAGSQPHASNVEAIGRELAEDVTVDEIPGAGHWLAEENPDAVVDSILRFDGRSRPG